MARPVRRITRKDIRRPDQFITLTGKVLELFAQHRTKFLALLILGYTQERSGRFKEAVQSFSQAETLQGSFKEEALLAKARSSTLMHNYNEALNAYRQFVLNYPNSERTKEAMLLAQEMEAKVGAAGGK